MKKICKNAVKVVIVITAKKKKKNKLHNCHFHLQKKRHFSLLEEVREFYLLLCLSQKLERESLIQSVILLSTLKEIISNKYLLQIKANKFRKEPCSLLTSRMSCLSSHLSTSGPSSVSALYTASLAIRMAAASWSKDAAIFWI